MALLHSHLEQISLSASAIAELPFPPPKMFANALLTPHDITTLIRDTEAHERALFSLDPSQQQTRTSRRGTMHPIDTDRESMASRIYSARNGSSRNQSAVARVLGGEIMQQIQRSTAASASKATRGDIDVQVLLRGAEMLCNVYPVPGAIQKIANLRYRHGELSESIARLEARVAEQAAQLEQMNYKVEDDVEIETYSRPVEVTDEDLERELEEIRELEQRKQMMEERVRAMEGDIGGLPR